MNHSAKKFAIALLALTWVTPASAQGEAELMLRSSTVEATQNQEFTVEVALKNPQRQNIISVRSWLEYDTEVLQATGVDTSQSLFTLSAPGEDAVSAGEGRVKIGRSNISGGMTESETVVAIVRFRPIVSYSTTTTIGFYDYQVSELGHTSVNIIEGGFPLNILSKKPDSLSIRLNPGAAPKPTTTPPPVVTTPPSPTTIPEVGGTPFNFDLKRPTQLMANTGTGYVDLVWSAEADPARMGFNIYYGKTSGQYSRRRSVGNVTNYRLDGLNQNEAYYLAVTAYDALNRESDYSNEVGIIVGQPLSSTNPFEGALGKVLARLPQQPQNGPSTNWLILSAVGFGGILVFGRRRMSTR